jgi:tetratricopeptide (TPR) repeat protein
MATDTAALAPKRPAPDPTRHVWQVPLFLVGAAVFVAAWQGWLPLGTPDPAADFTRDLAALRTAYEKVTPDRDELKDLLGRVAARVDSFPEQAPLARFALGSGYARLAELTPNPDEARGHWTLAKQHFERVRGEELRDPVDPPKLAYRSAKARVAVGLPPNTPVAELRLHITLLGNAPFGEEPGEAGRLQADLAMRLSPPDLQTAMESLTRYLKATGIATPAASLARAKYQLGDIHFRLKQPERAREWLEGVGSDAPDVIGPAKFLLARVRMSEVNWLGATRDLEAVRANPAVPPALKATAAYHLGICKLNTHEHDAAARAFEEALKAEPPEGIAAAVRLAELYLRADGAAKHTAAVDLLAAAVKGVTDPKDFRNPLVRLNEAVAVFELAISKLLEDGAYEPAVKATELYKSLSAAGREREMRAKALEAWATALQKSGGDYKPKAAAAAGEYKALAALQPDVSVKAEVYRRAAALYKLADNPEAAVAVLQDATKLPQLPESASGPVWSDLADALIATKSSAKEIIDAFNQAMKAAGPTGTATRYRLARQFAEARRPELIPLSRELFRQIAQQENVSAAEQEYHERAMVELAHEFIRAGNFPEAEVWLRKQLGFYQTGPEAPLGRLLLGVCLIQRASSPPPSGPDAATAARLLDEALKLFKQIVADADERHRRDGKLGERDAWLRLQAALRVLQTYQLMRKPNDLLAEADKLRDRHRGTVEELIILSLMYHAFKQKNEPGKELQVREQMKELFDRLPSAAFTAQSGEYSRTYWEKVWFTPEPK